MVTQEDESSDTHLSLQVNEDLYVDNDGNYYILNIDIPDYWVSGLCYYHSIIRPADKLNFIFPA